MKTPNRETPKRWDSFRHKKHVFFSPSQKKQFQNGGFFSSCHPHAEHEFTLPETATAPENSWLEDDSFPFGAVPYFQVKNSLLVSFKR